MKIYKSKYSLVTTCLLFLVVYAYSQNLLDTNFEKQDCTSSNESALKHPTTHCSLIYWKAVTTAIPVILPAENVIEFQYGQTNRTSKIAHTYRTYLQTDFSAPLEKDIWYKFSAQMKAAVSASVGIRDVAIFYGKTPFEKIINPYERLPLNPQSKAKGTLIPYAQFDYFKEWITLEKYYKAKGGETFLIIGNFNSEVPQYVNLSKDHLNVKTNPVNALCLIKNIKLEKIIPPKNYANELPPKLKSGDTITLNTIEFAVNEAVIPKKDYKLLENLAILFKSNKQPIEIIGHTDNQGLPKKNLYLSKARAQSVANFLLDLGIEKNRLTIQGKGANEPIANNQTAEGRQLNRRVVFKIK